MKEQFKALLENRAFDNYFELLACRLLGRKTGLTVYRLGGRRIIVDHSAGDQNGTKKCLVSDMYQGLMSRIDFGERPNILDLGGNGGGFTLLCDIELGPLGQVVSVEFNPDTYRRLWFNLKSNVSHDVEVLNAAVSGRNGTITVPDRAGSTSDRPGAPTDGEKSVEIELITLDTLVERHFQSGEIDLCKMDIEGAEYEVLLGEHSATLHRIRNLIIEIHPLEGRGAAALEERLEKEGFALQARAAPEHGDVRLYSK